MIVPVARALLIVTKRPAEVATFDVNFADDLATGETLSAYSGGFPSVSPSGQLTAIGTLSGTLAQITVSGGNAEELFTVDVATNKINVTAHTFADGDEVYFVGKQLPSPLIPRRTLLTDEEIVYYVRDAGVNDFSVTDKKDESGDLGSAIDLLSDGEGCVGHDYVVTIRCTTSASQTVEGEAVVMVAR